MDEPMNCIATFVAEDEEVTRVEMFTRGARERRKMMLRAALDTKRDRINT